ncbi:DUF4352 domain-containing protein [Streptomyces sp. NPDC051976]|uniref:DUF4352 domain-containing protein n=1 Tax=Streptomyces sp. NPDC051976 TaxID=3154947 RepID=UPI00343BE228
MPARGDPVTTQGMWLCAFDLHFRHRWHCVGTPEVTATTSPRSGREVPALARPTPPAGPVDPPMYRVPRAARRAVKNDWVQSERMSGRSRYRTGLYLAAALAAAGLGLAAASGCSSSGNGNQTTSGSTGAGPAASTTPAGASTPLTVGHSAEFFSQFTGEQGTTLRVAVNSIKYATSVPGPGGSPFRPTRGVYIVMSLTVTNAGQFAGSFNAPNFVWVSPAGQVVPDVGTTLGGAAPDQSQEDTTLQPGQHATGTEYFDVPAKGGQLNYEIGSGTAPLLVISLPAD